MFRYFPFPESLQSDEFGAYISFGIKVFDSSGREIASVSDVSVNKEFVADLCRRCTLYQLYPIHLYDVIEDHL